MKINKITENIIASSIEVHKVIGPGLLESTYEECLCYELTQKSIAFSRQLKVPVCYKGIKLDAGYQLDLLVEDQVIVELKSIDKLNLIHEAQLLTYMKLVNYTAGLLINFNMAYLNQGIRRKVLNHTE